MFTQNRQGAQPQSVLERIILWVFASLRETFFAALLPCLVWDGDPTVAIKAGADRLCPSAQVDLKTVRKLPPPGVEYRNDEASASRSPWLDANGWRIQRAGKGRFYYDVKGDAASLAAAEAYAYGADALIHTDPPGLDALARILPFLKQLKPADLPAMANIGLIDDGSDESGELMNLLARHNLLFRIVSAPDPLLNVNVRIGTKDYPKAEAADANRMAHKVRSQLSDDKRLLRIYGSEVVVGRLTGDRTRARLHLIDYAKRPVEGLRVRVLGSYPVYQLSVSGAPKAKLLDYSVEGDATEFTLPAMSRYAVIDLFAK